MKIKILVIFLYILTTQAFAEVKEVNNQEIMSLMQSGVPIIDIRRASEWQDTGIIKQSHLMTFFDKKGNYDLDEWLSKLKKIVKKGDPVIIICRSGRRSGIVSKLLDEQVYYSNVYNASGGILSWIASKNKIVIPN
ncbi:MAG: rhodanese-like domain-containing protein [Gammaproteobacteria bacterium]